MGDIKRKPLASKHSKLSEKTQTLEDLLATDSLFIEYFNAFLTLPAFPEPLHFNKETGGFEIVNDAKKQLANEIKAAVRSSRRRKKIYRPVHNHSYSAIPLVPIEDPKPEEEREIDTSFTIQSLNREQGIEWIKKERMPAFLESDAYVEYRLSRVIFQAQRAHKGDQGMSMKLDYSPPTPKEQEEDTDEDEPEEDPKEELMKDMYVSLGNTSAMDTEAWVSQAQSLLNTACTSVVRTRPTSAVVRSPRARSARGRPVSAAKSPGKSVTSDRDSGFWSPSKWSEGDLSVHASEEGSMDGEIPIGENHVPTAEVRRIGPRPSDPVCVLAEERGEVEKGGRVYTTPRLATANESQEEVNASLDERDQAPPWKQAVAESSDSADDQSVQVQTVNELGAVVVRTAMKHALSDISGMSVQEIEQHPDIQGILPANLSLTKDQLQKAEFILGKDSDSQPYLSTGKPEISKPDPDPNRDPDTQGMSAADNEVPMLALGKDKESDEDSLLNSDDDYEDERDDFFHRKKPRVHDLVSRKGMSSFKEFLRGTHGEKFWNLWLDIERAKLIKDQQEQSNFLLAIRERYEKQGGVYELSGHMKEQLGLVIPSHWVLDNLIQAQHKLAEPLILYWAPRFMLKQQKKVNPDSHYLYHHQKLIAPPTEVPYPNPPVAPLLPLRPKNCVPRTYDAVVAPPNQVQIQDMFAKEAYSKETHVPVQTSPLVGNKRVYELPDLFAPFKTEKEEKDKNNNTRKLQTSIKKTPRQLITPKMQTKLATSSLPGSRSSSRPGSSTDVRPPSAPASRSKSARSRPQSVKDGWGSLSSLTDSTSPRQRPVSADTRRSSLSEVSEMSEFSGGRRMEGLLQALGSEKQSGSFFRKHVEKSTNQWWKDCLEFWLDLQTYHQIFYTEVLDPCALRRKAKYLYSKYVVVGAPSSVLCDDAAREQVFRCLEPPYEELFDAVEEHVLAVLYEAWTHSLNEDIATFDKVELTEIKRHLNTKSRYVMSLQKRGIIKERPETPEDNLENYKDPVYDDSLWENIPEEYREFTLERLVHNRLELEHFRQFLAENYANMDLLCWMDIEAFRRIPHTEEKRRDMKAKDIKVKYFNKKYFFGANSPAGKEGQEKIMEAGGGWGKLLQDRPPTACLLEAQKYVRERLEKKWLPLFLATEGFSDRQRPKSGMSDVVEDVMIQRKKKSQAIWKMLESKWVSSSKDILTFRKALSNPVTSFHFRRFLSAKARSDHFFENDVLFWQEVQRYKDLCHIHSDRSLVQQKTAAIVNCFIESPIPPSLQVDITQEMADKIMDRKLEATPYLFREAQLTVFRMLFTRWQEFCHFRSNLTEDKILPTLERLRKKNMIAEKRRARELEEKREKQAKLRSENKGLDGEDLEAGSELDPFEKLSRGSDDGSLDNGDKKSVTWSYSQYMKALDEEQVLNEVDDTTFSSLSLNTQGVDTIADDASELGDKMSLANSARGSKMDGDVRKPRKESKKITKPEEDDNKSTTTKTSKVTKPKVDTSETGSQTDLKAKKIPATRPVSPKGPNKGLKSDGKTEHSIKDSAKAETQGSAEQADRFPTETASNQPRLVRKFPPLVGKR